MLKDPNWSSNYFNTVLDEDERSRMESEQGQGSILLFMDGTRHARIRRALTRSVDTAMTIRLSEYAAACTAELILELAEADADEDVDLIERYAVRLPLRMLARLIGIPDSDVPALSPDAIGLASMVDWKPSPDAIDSAAVVANALQPYFFELMKEKRRRPADDLMSRLVREAVERNLRYQDIVSICLLIVAAGQMTSTHMIGNGALALLRDERARRSFVARTADTREVVEELLRFDNPVQLTPRAALRDIECGGVRIPRGDLALGLIGSANRDPDAFPSPDTLDFARRKSESLSFGAGPHYCFGMQIAKVMGKAAFEALFFAFPGMRLATEALEWRPTLTQRGLSSLPVRLGPPSSTELAKLAAVAETAR
ncbi:MAG: cytochrome P450 [Pseudomonadota bacterium]